MSERYSMAAGLEEVVSRFCLKPPPFNSKPGYNIAPGASAPVICAGGLRLLKWGFVPAWSLPGAKPGFGSSRLPFFSAGNPLLKFSKNEDIAPEESAPARDGFVNARAEGIASRPIFRNAFYKTRCLVPADGFYEWQSSAGVKIPHRFEMRDKSLFAMAGVYEESTGTYAVVTAVSNALVRCVHHRMPVILRKADEALWLNPKMKDSETLLPLLRACDSDLMRGYRVSDLVNDPANDYPDCFKPAEQ